MIKPTPDDRSLILKSNVVLMSKVERIVKIQALVRAWLARNRVKHLKQSRVLLKKHLMLETNQNSDKVYCLVTLLKEDDTLVVVKARPV